jgi:hypothetical protein
MSLMNDTPKLDYGDQIRVRSGKYKDCVGDVVGISNAVPTRTYTVEFGDGSDAEIEEEILSKLNE